MPVDEIFDDKIIQQICPTKPRIFVPRSYYSSKHYPSPSLFFLFLSFSPFFTPFFLFLPLSLLSFSSFSRWSLTVLLIVKRSSKRRSEEGPRFREDKRVPFNLLTGKRDSGVKRSRTNPAQLFSSMLTAYLA